MVITLLGTNKRLKQLIRQFGPTWTVHERRAFVIALGGPGLLVSPQRGGDKRWISPEQCVAANASTDPAADTRTNQT